MSSNWDRFGEIEWGKEVFRTILGVLVVVAITLLCCGIFEFFHAFGWRWTLAGFGMLVIGNGIGRMMLRD